MRYRVILLVLICACVLSAAVQRGTVKAGGWPIPGATVTAIQGDIKQITSTDEKGNYVFEKLAPGRCTIEVEMFGFGKVSKEVEVTAEPGNVEWTLTLKRIEIEIAPAAAAQPAGEQAAKAPAAAPAGAAATPATPAAPAAAGLGAPQTAAAKPQPSPQAAKKAGNTRQAASNAAAKKGQPQQQPGFQRTDVNQTAQNEVLGENTNAGAVQSENLEQGANESLLVTGSVSRGLEFQRGEEGFGRDFGMMMGMGGPGMGGRGGGPGMGPGMGIMGPDGNIVGLDGTAGAEGLPGMLGAGGRGGEGGPGGGGRGGAGGMMAGGGGGMGGGGRGGGGGGGGRGGGGAGGRGGPGGDRGGQRGGPPRAAWQNRAQVSLLGNRLGRGREGYRGSLAINQFRNSIFNARSYSLNGQSVEKPSYQTGQYSFTVGGPLHIPKLIPYNTNTRINLSFGGNFGQTGTSRVATVPSDLERAGNFSQSVLRGSPVAVFDPLTGQPFPNSTIPTGRLNPAAVALLQYIPHPSQPGSIQNYQRSWNNPAGGNKNLGVQVTRIMGRTDRFNFGYRLQNRSSYSQDLLGFIDTSSGRGQSANIGWSHNFPSRLISNLSFSFSRNRSQAIPYFAYKENIAQQLGINGVSTDPVNWGPPTLSFTNFLGLSDTNPSLSASQSASLSEGLTWARGKQTISFGGGFRAQATNSHSDSNGRGTFTFTGFATSQLDANGQSIAGTGLDLADFLMGLPQQTSIRFGAADLYMRNKAYNLYVQDDYRIFTRLSLNFGVRWEVQPPITEKYGRMANLDIAPGYTGAVVVTPGQIGPYSGLVPEGLIHPDYNTFSPRFGLAWRPFRTRSTRVRAGFGIYFDSRIYDLISNRLAQQPPFAQTGTFTSTPANVLTLQDGFVGPASVNVTNTFAVDPWYRPGYGQTWNLTIQHDLQRSLMLDITYQGAKGTRLPTQTSPNVPLPGVNQGNKIANANTFIYQSSQSNSIYHAFQVRMNRRLGRGVSVQSRYSFSKLINNAQNMGGGVAQNYLNLAAERAVENAPHTFSANTMLTSPFGDSSAPFAAHGIHGKLLRDWTLTAMINLTSGAPVTAMAGGNRSLSGTGLAGNTRADATGLPVQIAHGWFNQAAFTSPAAGKFGNAGRNTIPGAGSFNMNVSFGRAFRLRETRRTIDFRVQVQNPLNYVNITRFGTTVGSSTYGLATGAGNMRTVTMNLRVGF